ncbi:MAG: acetylxylan esterase [Bryobacterales bacterium]|nr:acetylxylan esterase [Bryobacterales bacterium]
MRLLLVLLACLCSPLAEAQDSGAALTEWLNSEAQKLLASRDAGIAAIQSTGQAEQRKAAVRDKLLGLIGGLPNYAGPLNAHVTGSIDHGQYRIEKVIFESLPRYYVTGNLYVPNSPGKHPAVLMPMGHWEGGKDAGQRVCANLALKGFVALAFDPVGQGERQQSYDPRLEGSLAGGPTDQHFMNGPQAILAGESFARYRIWDAKRALDYLESRPEVDADRLGATGCSGGGTLTTYIAALDSRIKVAAPSCYLNSYKLLFTGSIGDSEQSLPNFLSSGLDQTDYVELFAPKPLLITSTEQDFFTPAGAKIVYDEARRWYRLYGAEDHIRWVVGPGGHGTPLEVREAVYEWFIRWLNGGKGDWREQPVTMHPNHELLVTRTGQVSAEGSRELNEIILEGLEARRKSASVDELKAYLRAQARSSSTPSSSTRSGSRIVNGVTVEQIAIQAEPDLTIGATLYTPADSAAKPGVLLVGSDEALATKMAAAGAVVLALRPRGTGMPDLSNRGLLGDWIGNTRAWLVGRNLPGLRAADILKGVDFLISVNGVRDVRAVARGVDGVWLLVAATLDPRIGRLWLDRTPPNLISAVKAPVHRRLHDATMPGFLLHWDLPDMVSAIGPAKIQWTDPSTWMGHVTPLAGNYQYRYPDQPDDDFIQMLLR